MTEALMKEPDKTTLGKQVETVTKDVRKLGRIAGHTAKRKLDEMRDRGEDLYDDARSRTRRTVEQRPWTALAVAAGVGALAGLLLTRGRS